jgi:hypothetical protein
VAQQDLRREERTVVATQPEGELYLTVKGTCYPVHSVLTISSMGVSLRLDHSEGEGTEVVVQYKHRDINVQVNGTVVWSAPAGEASAAGATDRLYDVGIHLMSPHLLFSLMQAG